jgi:hypothetical protein
MTCSTVLKKLIVAQLIKNFPAFYGTQASLPYSQEPPTEPISRQLKTVYSLMQCKVIPSSSNNVTGALVL